MNDFAIARAREDGLSTASPSRANKHPLKEFAKAVARGIATALIAPLLLTYWLRALAIGRDRALEHSTELLSLIPGLTGRYLRWAFLARVLARCSASACIGFGTVFSKAGAKIDDHVYIGPRCHIGLVHIERDVLLAAGVHVTSGGQTHGFADVSTPIRDQPTTHRLVRIGAGAWIGSAAVVMADVGNDTVVGAGAVVTKPLPERVIAAGVPARVLRTRDGTTPTEPQ